MPPTGAPWRWTLQLSSKSRCSGELARACIQRSANHAPAPRAGASPACLALVAPAVDLPLSEREACWRQPWPRLGDPFGLALPPPSGSRKLKKNWSSNWKQQTGKPIRWGRC